ncbi:urease accessory protein UreD [Kineococcus rhizosphaerae]|uniref:Urease accessory protein n=1 Tax=Kineococcus rhizosphaerae TaxID=559628 RepID=A0A2T0R2T3_9ACTN|nr:urease accessory protein UreD [Kineococcus rhizosphaerae]PRY14118.1 urease accessory protein [Kineococcus rhizosphaerae]
MSTRIALHPDGSLDLRADAFAPKVLHRTQFEVRIGLVGARALLLAGDDVELEVDVAAGCALELVEIAATVAHDGRGGTASWSTRAGVRGRFVWDAQPFVVADGARVERDLTVDLAPGGVLALRETVVWGRSGETGGALRSRTRVDVAGDPLLVEDLDLREAAVRSSPAVLGGHRVLDTVLVAGTRLAHPDALQLDGCGSVLRGFEHDALDGVWDGVRRGV